MKDFMELANRRYSVREFSDRKVEIEKLKLLIEALRISPTACNYQPQKVWVLDTEEELEKVRTVIQYHFHAPLILLLGYDDSKSWKNRYDSKDSGVVDTSISATHIMLEATELGLGSTFVGYFDEKLIKETFNIPENIHIVGILPIGYPPEDTEANRLHFEKKSINEFVVNRQWK